MCGLFVYFVLEETRNKQESCAGEAKSGMEKNKLVALLLLICCALLSLARWRFGGVSEFGTSRSPVYT